MEIDICPRWLLSRLGLAPEVRVHAALFLSSVFVLGISPLLTHVPHSCLAQRLLHIPCPGCGILHAIAALSRLQVGQSFRSNPAGLLLAGMLVFQVIARPMAMRWTELRSWVIKVSSWGNSLTLAGLFAVWGLRIFSKILHWQ